MKDIILPPPLRKASKCYASCLGDSANK